MKKINVLMCCSELNVKGGMVSVVKNYLGHKQWSDYNIIFVPTHTEKNNLIVALFFLFSYIKILCMIPFYHFEIAHLHTAERGSFFRKAILVRTLKKFGIKTVMHHHAAEFEQFYASLSERGKKYVNDTLKLADINIVLSKNLVSMITEKVPNAKVKVLYNAVKTYDENPYNQNAKNILFLGRLGKRKGIYDLLEAIRRIDNIVDRDVKFYLCGDGDEDNVMKVVKEFGLESRIAHIGWIDRDLKRDILNDTSINVLPSYNEGLPMSILETMAYGIPSVTTNVASIPEVVISNVNGCLIEPGNIEQLIDCILLLINKPDIRKRYSKNAYELITKSFSLKNHVKTLLNYYDDLLGDQL